MTLIDLVSNVRESHNRLSRYYCECVLTRSISVERQFSSHFKMTLSYQRPDCFLILWHEIRKRPYPPNVILSSLGKTAVFKSPEFEWTFSQNLDEAIARHAGISAGMVTTVPMLFMGSPLQDPLSNPFQFVEESAGSCGRYKIDCLFGEDHQRTVYVRASDYMISEIHDTYSVSGGTVVSKLECNSIVIEV